MKTKGRPVLDITGKRFGMWVVLGRADKGLKKEPLWLCRCDCGREYSVRGGPLKNGTSTKCAKCSKLDTDVKSRKDDRHVAITKITNEYSWGAKRRGLAFELSRIDVEKLVFANCHYCGAMPSNICNHQRRDGIYVHQPTMYNGIDRVDNSKGYILGNCVTCCHQCNWAKRDLSYEQFIGWIRNVYGKQIKRNTTSLTPGQLIDLLFTTDYKCWWAQEDLMKYKDSDPEKSAQAAVRAQEYNAKRTKLMRTIDSVLDFSDDTNTEKTYSDGNIDEKENYTYFKDEK